jgi:hypothetical protein
VPNHETSDPAEIQVIDCVRQKIHEKQLLKEIATTQKQITMVTLTNTYGIFNLI